METQKPKVIVIESDENQRYLYDIALEFQKLNVLTTSTIDDGLKLIGEIQPDLVLIDEIVADFRTFNLVGKLEEIVPEKIPAIIITDLRDNVTREAEKKKIFKAFDYLVADENTVGNIIRSSRKAINL